MKATTTPNGDIHLCTEISKEEYAELKLALLDIALDGICCPLTDNGKEALHRIASLFRNCFVQEVEVRLRSEK